jgi:peptidoglycan/xylan/chitin deacetylase (PgdA/CDA1 family)
VFIEQPPEFFRKLYPGAVWRMDPNEKAVYLTFDDGPIPEVTPWVLDLLDKHNIKATFFMVGDNIRKHPDEFRMVVERGHRIGNHTFNHIRGFEYTAKNYLGNTEQATIRKRKNQRKKVKKAKKRKKGIFFILYFYNVLIYKHYFI